MRKSNLAEAKAQDAEERSWWCSTCDKMIEEHEKGSYCRLCRMYWDDVRNGAFDEAQ